MLRAPDQHALNAEENAEMKENTVQYVSEAIGECAFERFPDIGEYRETAGKRLREITGLAQMEAMNVPPPSPEILWERDLELGHVSKLAFFTEPGEQAFAYLCLPKKTAKPYPAFLCLHGHGSGMHWSLGVKWEDETTPLPIENDRDFALGCLRRGIAAIVLEQRFFGERSNREDHMPSCLYASLQNLLIGRTTIGERVFDVRQLIRYLASRGDIDFKNLGVMGGSGGGTASLFAAALLPEITHVMPAVAFSSFRGSIGAMPHCACNYIPNLLRFGESADVAGLIAPRPIVLVNGRFDPIFPLAEAERQFARLQKIYAAAGAPDNCRLVVGEGEHRFYAEAAWNAMLEFFPVK